MTVLCPHAAAAHRGVPSCPRPLSALAAAPAASSRRTSSAAPSTDAWYSGVVRWRSGALGSAPARRRALTVAGSSRRTASISWFVSFFRCRMFTAISVGSSARGRELRFGRWGARGRTPVHRFARGSHAVVLLCAGARLTSRPPSARPSGSAPASGVPHLRNLAPDRGRLAPPAAVCSASPGPVAGGCPTSCLPEVCRFWVSSPRCTEVTASREARPGPRRTSDMILL
jgi:hypothetical protein